MATENKKLNINVSVEGLNFQLTVKDSDEEKLYRDAATLIQHRVQHLREVFPTLANEKYYYVMAMLNTAVKAMKVNNEADNTPFMEMMSDLEKEYDSIEVLK